MAVAGLVGCADKLTDEVVQSPEDIGGETGYISFRIKSADTGGMTRAWKDQDGDYDIGDVTEIGEDLLADENTIVSNIQANRVFFFKDGKYHSSSFLNLTTKGEDSGHEGDDVHKDDGYGQTESVYSATVKRTSDRGEQNWPDECLVILNGRPSRLNALLARAQADLGFNKKQFLEWVNKDVDDEQDNANDGFTLGLYKYGKGEGDNSGKYMYYFTMTNSVFLDKDKATVTGSDGTNTEENVVIDATKIDAEKLYATSEEAAKNPITVYVERIMSKVEVEFKDKQNDVKEIEYGNNQKGYLYTFTDDHETNSKWFEEGESKTMKVLVTNWTINAIEYQTKLFKNIEKTWVSEDKETDNPFKGWNDYKHHRSYWAIDEHYKWNSEEYPTQYRKVYPKPENSTAKSYEDFRVEYPHRDGWIYGEDTEEHGNDATKAGYKWALDYKSFNTIKSNSQYKYCLENTFECEESTPQNKYMYQNMIMGSHILVQARLLTEDEVKNDVVDLEKIADKYYYSDRYYNEEYYIKRQLAVINEVLSENVGSLFAKNVNMWPKDDESEILSKEEGHENEYHFDHIAGGLWIKGENGKYKKVVAEVEEDKEESQIEATEVFNIAPAYVEKGDGKVTIALKDRNTNPAGSGDCAAGYGYTTQKVNLYYFPYAGTNDEGQPLEKVKVKDNNGVETEVNNEPVQFTRNQLVSLIYRATNIADCFKHGMMYYAVPIQHFIAGTHTDADGNRDGNYEYKYEDVKTGDYGVVRNHWYKFTINAIAKPGVPVHDPDQPIIPNYDNEDRYIGFEVVILPWHIVDNGNVTLGQ